MDYSRNQRRNSQAIRMQQEHIDKGKLQIQITSQVTAFPIQNAQVSISYTGVPENTLEKLQTDSSGQTEEIELAAPPIEYSLNPESDQQPYSEYTLNVEAEGFEPVSISGAEILADVTAIQNISMRPQVTQEEPGEVFVIPAHTLYGEYPAKIAEDEIKPVTESGEIVLSRVVIPEFVVVHDGSPRDSTAKNYYVRYRDYIKNVASSEIYATWPDSTIRANVLAIMSFTLNRVYTEWYRNKGYDFTITSSTAFDHKWIPERNVYDTISAVVDEIFANYLSRPNVRQPILTQYCDGTRVSCPDWMTQWGSKELGDQGYTPIEILRYFYGSDMYINTAEEISGIKFGESLKNIVSVRAIPYTAIEVVCSLDKSASDNTVTLRKAVSYAVKNSENLSGVNTNGLSPTMATFEIKGANFVNEKGETVVGEYNDNNYKYSFYCKKGLNGNRVYNYIKKMITE